MIDKSLGAAKKESAPAQAYRILEIDKSLCHAVGRVRTSWEYGNFEIAESLGTLSQEYVNFDFDKSLGRAVEA